LQTPRDATLPWLNYSDSGDAVGDAGL